MQYIFVHYQIYYLLIIYLLKTIPLAVPYYFNSIFYQQPNILTGWFRLTGRFSDHRSCMCVHNLRLEASCTCKNTWDWITFLGQKQGTDASDQQAAGKEASSANIKTTLKGSMGERITKALAKVEEKKKKRAARKAEVGSSDWSRNATMFNT